MTTPALLLWFGTGKILRADGIRPYSEGRGAVGRAIREELWYACHRQAFILEDSLRSAARPYGGMMVR